MRNARNCSVNYLNHIFIGQAFEDTDTIMITWDEGRTDMICSSHRHKLSNVRFNSNDGFSVVAPMICVLVRNASVHSTNHSQLAYLHKTSFNERDKRILQNVRQNAIPAEWQSVETC
jgi:hypothetical protein